MGWVTTRFGRRLGLIMALALLWRVIYVHFEIHYMVLTDEAWYIGMAQRLFGPHRWTSLFNYNIPTAEHGPLTSVVIAPFAWIFPHALEGLRYVLCFVGTLSVLMFALAAKRLGGERAALVAASVAAVFPDFWIRDGLVVSEPLAILFVVSCFYLAVRWRTEVTWFSVVAYGALVGLEALTRPEIVPVLVLVAIVALRPRALKVALIRLGGLVVVAMLVVAPWTIYNAGRFQGSVLLSNNLGTTLVGANCPLSYYNANFVGYDAPACWNAAVAKARLVTPDEARDSSIMTHQALSYAWHHPARLGVVLVYRELWFLGLYHPGWVVHLGTLGGQPAWATWLQAVSLWVSLPLAFALWRRYRLTTWPTAFFVALVVNSFVVAAVFVGHWRYRVTLDVAVVLVLALGIDRWWPRRNRRAVSVTAPPAGTPQESSPTMT